VRANCVCPGVIETGSLAALRQHLARERGVPPEGVLEQVMAQEWHMDVALGRPGRPQEVGELFAFLLSPRAGYRFIEMLRLRFGHCGHVQRKGDADEARPDY